MENIEFWRAIFDQLPVSVGILDANSDVFYVNDHLRHSSSFLPLEVGGNFLEVCSTQQENSQIALRLADGLQEIFEGQNDTFEIEHDVNEGEFSQHYLTSLTRYNCDQQTYIVVKQQSLSTTPVDFQRDNDVVSLNRAMSLLISSVDETTNIEKLAAQIAETVVQAFHFVNCSVVLVDKHSHEGHYVARVGETYALDVDTISLDASGILPTAFQEKSIVYEPDVASGPHRSELVVPLVNNENEVIGALDLLSVERDAFTLQDQHALDAFAVKAATILENARLHNRIQNQAQELERRVVERTAQLQREKERAEAIFNHTSDAIILTDRKGNIRQINRACARLFEYPDIQNATIFDLAHPSFSGIIRDHLKRAYNEASYQQVEVVARRGDGAHFGAEIAFSVLDRDGEDRLLICSIHDITHHKQLQDSLRNALEHERNLGELKSRFVSMASHEFRTPLTTILASSEYVRLYRDRIDEQKIERKLSLVHDQVDYMTKLLDDVLTFGRLDSGRVTIVAEDVDLITLCEQLIEEVTMSENARNRIVFQCESMVSEVRTDKHLMRTVITNLLSNALKYSPQEATVDFDLRCDDYMISFTISDKGIGIPEQDKPLIFDPFHRASNVGAVSGTGLGLAIIKRQLELIGGSIDFSSVAKKGTTFMVEVPRLK